MDEYLFLIPAGHTATIVTEIIDGHLNGFLGQFASSSATHALLSKKMTGLSVNSSNLVYLRQAISWGRLPGFAGARHARLRPVGARNRLPG